MKKLIALIMIAGLITELSGCAAISRGSKQQIHVSAYDEVGNIIPCNCELTNDEGVVRTTSNRSVVVGRDKDLLRITCENKDYFGSTTVDGEINMGFWAVDFFVIDLCIISGWIDGLSGAWAEYPQMVDVQLVKKD